MLGVASVSEQRIEDLSPEFSSKRWRQWQRWTLGELHVTFNLAGELVFWKCWMNGKRCASGVCLFGLHRVLCWFRVCFRKLGPQFKSSRRCIKMESEAWFSRMMSSVWRHQVQSRWPVTWLFAGVFWGVHFRERWPLLVSQILAIWRTGNQSKKIEAAFWKYKS